MSSSGLLLPNHEGPHALMLCPYLCRGGKKALQRDNCRGATPVKQ